MIVSIIIISVVVYICLIKKSYDVICLLITLLPFHNFISKLLSILTGNVGLFPIWRDVCCIFLFYKVIKNDIKNKSIHTLILLNILYITFILFLFWGTYEKSISYYRIYIDVLLLAYSLSQIKLDEKQWKRIFKTYAWVSFVVCITGFIQYFLIREQLHILFEDYELRSDGSIHFTSPSWLIMGYERMGGFIGGPNSFGIYLSIALFIMLTIYNKYKNKLPNKQKLFLLCCILIYGICLLLSFSRAGWGITIFSYYLFLLRYYNTKKIISKSFTAIFVVLLILIIGVSIFPEVYEIIKGTFSGEEASAATRDDMVKDAYLELLGSIYGNGLGSTDTENGVFFAESSFLNLIFEIGIQGCILFYLIFICILFINSRAKNFIAIIVTSFIPIALFISIASVNIMTWPFIYYLFGFSSLALNKSLKRIII